jgi:hypothetical protein
LNTALKTIVLHISRGENFFDAREIGFFFAASVLEYAALFVGYLSVIFLKFGNQRQALWTTCKFRIYLALSFPELLKLVALALQLFDCEPIMLMLLGLLVMSIQHFSMCSVTTILPGSVVAGVVLSTGLKMWIRMLVHPLSDTWTLGVIL